MLNISQKYNRNEQTIMVTELKTVIMEQKVTALN